MWDYNKSVFYQMYPLGLCGAPYINDGVVAHRIDKIRDYIPHLVELGIDAIYLSPIFASDSHGYDTRDYFAVDNRLGTNDDFRAVVDELHAHGIKVVIDGVFNHVGRGFWAFQDVIAKRESSPYRWWFNISFDGNTEYNDGFWYEGWEGHNELVKLNLRHPDVISHLLDAVTMWIDELGIDGIRLDVAYMVDRDFMRTLRRHVLSKKADFFLVGESIHGDYNAIVNDDMLMSATNYECYKGLYSSFNSYNMFEIMHSLMRQFGREPWTLYKGKHLLNFVDNHDVSRIASMLTNKAHLPIIYAMLFAMPGIPCIYYGSEWGAEATKERGSDANLRPYFDTPIENDLTRYIARLSRARHDNIAFSYGDFESVGLTNKQCAMRRVAEGNELVAVFNIEDAEYTLHLNNVSGHYRDALSGVEVDIDDSITLMPYSALYLIRE